MTEQEAGVIEAAQDLADEITGGHYGPNEAQIKRATRFLMDRVADLAAENDGRWRRKP